MWISLLFMCVVLADFHEEEAVKGWQLTNAAYCNTESIQTWGCMNCVNSGYMLIEVQVFENDGAQGFVGYDPTSHAVIVTFRGTSNLQNWIDNIDLTLAIYPLCTDCKVHTGFYRSWSKISYNVRESVRNLLKIHSGSTIRVYGHSLGGAMAVHAAADFSYILNQAPEWLYTFGTPRVGNDAFAAWFPRVSSHQRITHRRDPVPGLPPREYISNFTHTPNEIWYPTNRSERYDVCDGSGEDPHCSNSVVSVLVSDHLNYMGSDCCCKSQSVLQIDNHTNVKPQSRFTRQ